MFKSKYPHLSRIINYAETRLVVRTRYFGQKIAPMCITRLPLYEIQLLAQTKAKAVKIGREEDDFLVHLVYTNTMSHVSQDLRRLYPFDATGVACSVYSADQISQQFDVIFKSWENRSQANLWADPWLNEEEVCFFKVDEGCESEPASCADQQLLQQLSRISMWLDCKISIGLAKDFFEIKGLDVLSSRLRSFICSRNQEWAKVRGAAETLVELLSSMG